jgi:hypothetical protein
MFSNVRGSLRCVRPSDGRRVQVEWGWQGLNGDDVGFSAVFVRVQARTRAQLSDDTLDRTAAYRHLIVCRPAGAERGARGDGVRPAHRPHLQRLARRRGPNQRRPSQRGQNQRCNAARTNAARDSRMHRGSCSAVRDACVDSLRAPRTVWRELRVAAPGGSRGPAAVPRWVSRRARRRRSRTSSPRVVRGARQRR